MEMLSAGKRRGEGGGVIEEKGYESNRVSNFSVNISPIDKSDDKGIFICYHHNERELNLIQDFR